MNQDRIYLDNAATSWPKAPGVGDAIADYYRESGAPAGRGTYSEAIDVQRQIDGVRALLARLINAENPNSVVFTYNGTDSLNIVLQGFLRDGDHVVTTATEHNSVLRPLRQLEKNAEVTHTTVTCNSMGWVDPDLISDAIRENTKLVCINHASNVLGTIQPIQEIIDHCRKRNVATLVDAAQTLGHLPIDVQALGCEFLAAPGHKGLLGPLGTGVLYIAEGNATRLIPMRAGGTGSRSDEDVQPTEMPDRFESGNLNVGGILGLGMALEYLNSEQGRAARNHGESIARKLFEGLKAIDRIDVLGPSSFEEKVAVTSIRCDAFDPRELTLLLDSVGHVQTRSGLHCAPLIHKAIGTFESGGTVRFSPGVFNSEFQIDHSLELLRSIVQS